MTTDIDPATLRPTAARFAISAPAMIYGHDIVENAEILADMVENIEIVLFHTPTQNNFLSRADVRQLSHIANRCQVTYTVHLPDSLEIASASAAKRAESVRRTLELIAATEEIRPQHFILHVPFTPPTLVPVPGSYLTSIPQPRWQDWLKRAAESLSTIVEHRGPSAPLLVENINYSLSFLEPLVQSGLCNICLDIGHLLLGQEGVRGAMKRYRSHIQEIHIHGIKDDCDHHSLALLPQDRFSRWMEHIIGMGYEGIFNLEVFSPRDLAVSLALLARTLATRLRG
jgi:sugar phosphate isomerase/epimerase